MAHHSTLRIERGGVEVNTPLPKIDPLQLLQIRIDEANRIIHEGDPLTIAGALAMEAKARAEVLKMLEG